VNEVYEFEQSFSSSAAADNLLKFTINDSSVNNVYEFEQSFTSSSADYLQSVESVTPIAKGMIFR
jgi:hypothetical protein